MNKGNAFVVVLLAAVLLPSTGCDLAPISSPYSEMSTSPFQGPDDPKLRHANMLGSTLLEAPAGKDGDEAIRIIIQHWEPKQDTDGWLGRHGWLRRYSWLRRYDVSGGITYSASAVQIDPKAARKAFGVSDEADIVTPVLLEILADPSVQLVEPDMRIDAQRVAVSPAPSGNQTLPWNIEEVGASSPKVSEAQLESVDLYILDTNMSGDDLNVTEEVEFARTNGNGDRTHGYLVAGVAAARDNDTGVLGVAPGARVHSFVVLTRDGVTSMSTVIEALNEIIRRHPAGSTRRAVVSISFGAYLGFRFETFLDETITKAADMGIIVVVSAGNDAVNAQLVTPAHARGAISVGAYDKSRNFAAFSNFGSGVDLHAPGVDILSLGKITNKKIELLIASGTSFATPHVAGAAVAFLALHPTANRQAVLSAISSPGCVAGVPSGTTASCLRMGGVQ